MALARSASQSHSDISSLGHQNPRGLAELRGVTPIQVHEDEEAEVVLVCEPEGTSLMMGGLHPRASLYDRPINLEVSRSQHQNFRKILRDYGLKVLTVREVLAYGVERHVGARMELEDLAMKVLKYSLKEGFAYEDIPESGRHYLSDAYKREVLEQMSLPQLIDVLLINPSVILEPYSQDTGFKATYSFQPLSNLIYTRDQQITTCKGIVMGNLRSSQRHLEVDLLRFCFDKLGMEVLGKVSGDGYLEGGDFVPAGLDLCFIGVGLRSNLEGCLQMMSQDWLGTRRVAIVKDKFEQHQDRMHLDCVFSLVGRDCCMMLDEIMGSAAPTRRLVDEYVKNRETNQYELARRDIELSEFVFSEGYKIIPITRKDQLNYGCNVLNLGNGSILSVDLSSARELVKSPHFTGTVQVIDFTSITSMYGGVHCSTQVLRRKHRIDRAV